MSNLKIRLDVKNEYRENAHIKNENRFQAVKRDGQISTRAKTV